MNLNSVSHPQGFAIPVSVLISVFLRYGFLAGSFCSGFNLLLHISASSRSPPPPPPPHLPLLPGLFFVLIISESFVMRQPWLWMLWGSRIRPELPFLLKCMTRWLLIDSWAFFWKPASDLLHSTPLQALRQWGEAIATLDLLWSEAQPDRRVSPSRVRWLPLEGRGRCPGLDQTKGWGR